MSWGYCVSAPLQPSPAQQGRYLDSRGVKFGVTGSRRCSRPKVTQWEHSSCPGAREKGLTWDMGTSAQGPEQQGQAQDSATGALTNPPQDL